MVLHLSCLSYTHVRSCTIATPAATTTTTHHHCSPHTHTYRFSLPLHFKNTHQLFYTCSISPPSQSVITHSVWPLRNSIMISLGTVKPWSHTFIHAHTQTIMGYCITVHLFLCVYLIPFSLRELGALRPYIDLNSPD